MKHSKNFDKIKRWYDSGLWDDKKVRDAADKGQITEEEYNEIVNK